jgi:hypothetical protein
LTSQLVEKFIEFIANYSKIVELNNEQEKN